MENNLKIMHFDFRGQKLTCSAIKKILPKTPSIGFNAILMEYMDSFPFSGKLSFFTA